MTFPAYTRRTIVFRASGETLILIAAATAMTFALASVVHKRPQQQVESASVVQQQDWTGHLAGLPSDQTIAKTDAALTSASLVVPPSALALPADSSAAAPTRAPGAPTKASRPCDGPACSVTAKSTGVPVPPNRDKAPVSGNGPTKSDIVHVKSEGKTGTSLIGKLNPLNHIPDAVSRPFNYAGDKLAGWFNRL